jgi:hypothetical protein
MSLRERAVPVSDWAVLNLCWQAAAAQILAYIAWVLKMCVMHTCTEAHDALQARLLPSGYVPQRHMNSLKAIRPSWLQ